MNQNKQSVKNVNVDEKLNCNSMFIKISHYKDDKLLKTETFPMIHFLEYLLQDGVCANHRAKSRIRASRAQRQTRQIRQHFKSCGIAALLSSRLRRM